MAPTTQAEPQQTHLPVSIGDEPTLAEIIEFQEPRWEPMQEQAAKRYGYTLLSHTHKLYGLCGSCQKQHGKPARKEPELHVEEIVA